MHWTTSEESVIEKKIEEKLNSKNLFEFPPGFQKGTYQQQSNKNQNASVENEDVEEDGSVNCELHKGEGSFDTGINDHGDDDDFEEDFEGTEERSFQGSHGGEYYEEDTDRGLIEHFNERFNTDGMEDEGRKLTKVYKSCESEREQGTDTYRISPARERKHQQTGNRNIDDRSGGSGHNDMFHENEKEFRKIFYQLNGRSQENDEYRETDEKRRELQKHRRDRSQQEILASLKSPRNVDDDTLKSPRNDLDNALKVSKIERQHQSRHSKKEQQRRKEGYVFQHPELSLR